MKKEAIILLIIILIMPAVLGKAECSDGSVIIWGQNELKIGSSKIINGLGIGLIQSDEITALRRITTNLVIDAISVSLKDTNSSEEIELVKGKYTVSLINITSDSAGIKIDSESKEIAERDFDTIKGLIVMVVNADNTNLESAAKLLIGSQQITLSNNEKLYEKVIAGNATYLIELISASDADAIIMVSNCKSGDILDLNDIENKTMEINQTNQTVTNNTENQNITANISENNLSGNKTINETISSSPPEEKIGFFRRIINWIKSLFNK